MSHTALKQDETVGQTLQEPTKKKGTDLPVGEILRRTRLHYGKSVNDVEAVLRIKAAQIDAIETGHYEHLPARVYALGFVRSYARYLGLDENYIVELFKQQSITTTVTPDLNFPVSVKESKVPNMWMIVASLALLLIAPTLWYQFSNDKPINTSSDIPPVTQEITDSAMIDNETLVTTATSVNEAAQNAIDTSIETPQEQADIEPAAGAEEEDLPQEPIAEEPAPTTPEGVVIKVVQDSWVEIRNAEGKRIVSRVLKIGEEYFVPDRPGLTMSIGNAAGVEISVDGEVLPPLGAQGSVIRDIPLSAEMLKNLEKGR